MNFTEGVKGRIQEFALGDRPFPFPSSSLPLPLLSLSLPHFPPLELGPLKLVMGVGSTVSSPAGSGAEPWPKTNLVHSKAARKPRLQYSEVDVLHKFAHSVSQILTRLKVQVQISRMALTC